MASSLLAAGLLAAPSQASTAPHRVSPHGPPIANIIQVAVGGDHTCAVQKIALLYTVWCWGANNDDQLGQVAGPPFFPVPLPVTTLTSTPDVIKEITAGEHHTCVEVKAGGWKVECWGFNNDGQLGDNTFVNSSTPVVALNGVAQISAGGNHTCARVGAGVVKCWGQGTKGEIGDGFLLNRKVPTAVVGLPPATLVAAGGQHTCAVQMLPHHIWCWGYGASGQIGDGHFLNRRHPRITFGGLIAHDISAGGQDSCATILPCICSGLSDSGHEGIALKQVVQCLEHVDPLLAGSRDVSADGQVVGRSGFGAVAP